MGYVWLLLFPILPSLLLLLNVVEQYLSAAVRWFRLHSLVLVAPLLLPLGIAGRVVPYLLPRFVHVQLWPLFFDPIALPLAQLLHATTRLGKLVLETVPRVWPRHHLPVVLLRFLVVAPISRLGFHYLAALRLDPR